MPVKKICISALLLILALGTISGCNPKKAANSESPQASEAPRTEEVDYSTRGVDQNMKEGMKALQDERYDEAEKMFLTALSQVEAYSGQEARTAIILNNLAAVYEAKEMYIQAMPLLRKAQKLFIRAYGTDYPAVAITLGNMGRILMKEKRFEEAAQVYRTAAGLMEKNPKVDKKDYRDMLERYLESLRFSKKGALAADVEAKLKALK
ncbi:MAG: tetratricopeptide repeat protein [Cyanobacteria bacterium HKST-UBA02]|nr:tetratricopeptide repeat protein [Cyanobacteria bacterium HKST-UBA02]